MSAGNLIDSSDRKLQASDVLLPSRRSTLIRDKLKCLKCCFFNARSVLNKLVDLRSLLCDSSVHLVAVAETWLTGNDDALLVSGSNLRVFHSVRACDKSRDGGSTFAC